MARKIIVVTAAYGNDHVKSLGGQAAVLPFIADAGADGVEIRRELFSAEALPWPFPPQPAARRTARYPQRQRHGAGGGE